ncbi:MAG TPA: hypothetical protein VLE73_03200 [Candidatus Saccharimonadales bacterium]|nr:hypothetical protein [Candidatus Saccharimonadales bacterium]
MKRFVAGLATGAVLATPMGAAACGESKKPDPVTIDQAEVKDAQDYFDKVIDFWQSQLDVNESAPNLHIVNGNESYNCVDGARTTTIYSYTEQNVFCPGAGNTSKTAVAITAFALREELATNGGKSTRNFNIAHEGGHWVIEASSRQNPNNAVGTPKQEEWQADCYAGTAVATLDGQNSAVAVLAHLGALETNTDAQATYGTNEEQQAAFLQGSNGGPCDVTHVQKAVNKAPVH